MRSIYTTLNDENYQMLEILSNIKGIKKTHIINEALENYFNTLKTIPEEFILKTIYITHEEFERLEQESKPTKDLEELLNDN